MITNYIIPLLAWVCNRIPKIKECIFMAKKKLSPPTWDEQNQRWKSVARPLLGWTSFLFDHCQDLCVSNNNFVFIPSIFPMIIPADQKGLVSIISF